MFLLLVIGYTNYILASVNRPHWLCWCGSHQCSTLASITPPLVRHFPCTQPAPSVLSKLNQYFPKCYPCDLPSVHRPFPPPMHPSQAQPPYLSVGAALLLSHPYLTPTLPRCHGDRAVATRAYKRIGHTCRRLFGRRSPAREVLCVACGLTFAKYNEGSFSRLFFQRNSVP